MQHASMFYGGDGGKLGVLIAVRNTTLRHFLLAVLLNIFSCELYILEKPIQIPFIKHKVRYSLRKHRDGWNDCCKQTSGWKHQQYIALLEFPLNNLAYIHNARAEAKMFVIVAMIHVLVG